MRLNGEMAWRNRMMMMMLGLNVENDQTLVFDCGNDKKTRQKKHHKNPKRVKGTCKNPLWEVLLVVPGLG